MEERQEIRELLPEEQFLLEKIKGGGSNYYLKSGYSISFLFPDFLIYCPDGRLHGKIKIYPETVQYAAVEEDKNYFADSKNIKPDDSDSVKFLPFSSVMSPLGTVLYGMGSSVPQDKKLKLEIPPVIYFLYLFFLYGSIFLGEVRNFYYKYDNWDTILHFSSSMMLGSIGFSIVLLLNKNLKSMSLSPILVLIFSICFAMTVGTIWEMYEFTFDGLLGMNMQKYALEDGTELIGRLALVDTMKDLIIDLCGASLMSILGYLSLINNVAWFYDNIKIKQIDK